jgi:hypothetical protein
MAVHRGNGERGHQEHVRSENDLYQFIPVHAKHRENDQADGSEYRTTADPHEARSQACNPARQEERQYVYERHETLKSPFRAFLILFDDNYLNEIYIGGAKDKTSFR